MHHFTKMLQGKMMQSAMISATAVPNVGLMAKERERGALHLYPGEAWHSLPLPGVIIRKQDFLQRKAS